MIDATNCVTMDVPRDGNCLFHAIVCCLQQRLSHVQYTHLTLRRKVIQYMRDNTSATQKNIILQEYSSFGDLNQYFTHMKRARTWGDEFIIQAMSDMLQRTIFIYNKDVKLMSTYAYESRANTEAKQPLYIMFDSCHFKALRPKHNTASNKTMRQNDGQVSRTSKRKRKYVDYSLFY